jgi:hypothetical protein
MRRRDESGFSNRGLRSRRDSELEREECSAGLLRLRTFGD